MESKTVLIFLGATLMINHALSQCVNDADCADGCCSNDHIHGSRCHLYQNDSQPCHLTGNNAHLYPCGCRPGLTCQQIHFDSSLGDPVHQAELLLLGHGYGMCSDSAILIG